MTRIKNFLFSLLTSGKYSSISDEKDVDAIVRLMVLNVTYIFASVLIIGIGISDMRAGFVDQGLLEVIVGSLILINLLLLRTKLPFLVGGLITITIYGIFCAAAVFARNAMHGFFSLWIFSFPLMSIFSLGIKFGLIPALLLFFVTVIGTFVPSLSGYNYSLHDAIMICGVYLFILALAVIYERVRSLKDKWLSRQDRYMNMVFQNSPDIILLLDKDGMLVYCADVFFKKTKILNFETIRKTHYRWFFSFFCDSAQLREIVKSFNKSKAEKTPVDFEQSLDIGGDGDFRHYSIHFTPMHDETGVFQGTFILFHDMTEIFETNKRMEQASQSKSNFLAAMSHEIRTPLNAIIGMTNIASGSPEPERKDYCLGKISGASSHLLGVINDILDMSKIEEGKLELSPAEFDFSAMLQRIMSFFEFSLAGKHQKLVVNTDPLIPGRVIADEQRLAQVITNLVSNAIKFTSDGGRIGVEVNRIDHREDFDTCILEFRISDTGIGIPEDAQGHLFRSFGQVDSSISRRFGGTGLGLAISKKIVEMMSGDIRVESEIDKGSTFIFTIRTGVPRQTAQTAESGAGSVSDTKYAAEDYSGKHILLAEDIELNREIIFAILEDFNLDITSAENGQQAVDKFSADPEKFDLIFMDIHMPEVNGYEAAALIRAVDHPRAKTIPIVALTANVFKEDIERCFAAGMNDHVGKPLNFEDFFSVLRKYLAG